ADARPGHRRHGAAAAGTAGHVDLVQREVPDGGHVDVAAAGIEPDAAREDRLVLREVGAGVGAHCPTLAVLRRRQRHLSTPYHALAGADVELGAHAASLVRAACRAAADVRADERVAAGHDRQVAAAAGQPAPAPVQPGPAA